MKTSLKASIAAVLLSSIAMVPAVTFSVVATTDAAYAKSENAGGGGKGNGGGQNGNRGGKSSDAKSKSKSAAGATADRAKSNNGKKGGLEGLLNKLTGQDKKAARVRSSPAPKAARTAKKLDPMHPSNLGKMNGPMNANVNALIAHIKNGNANGPIGGMAALAVAGYAAEGANAVVVLNDRFMELDDLLVPAGYGDADGMADVDAYLAALEGVPGNDPITSIEDAIASGDSAAIADALMGTNNGEQDFADVGAYETWRDGVAGVDPIPGADSLIGELEGESRPTVEEVDYAEERISERTDAEDYMLSIWNKGDGDDTMRSPAEDDLIQALNARLAADGGTLTDAIEEYGDLPDPLVLETDPACDLAEGCEAPAEEEVAIAD